MKAGALAEGCIYPHRSPKHLLVWTLEKAQDAMPLSAVRSTPHAPVEGQSVYLPSELSWERESIEKQRREAERSENKARWDERQAVWLARQLRVTQKPLHLQHVVSGRTGTTSYL